MPTGKATVEPLSAISQRSDTDVKQHQARLRLKGEYDKEFALCAMNFWYWLQFIKTEDEDAAQVRPFPIHFDSLRKLDHEINKYQKVIVLKARRGLISWFGVLRQMHKAMFAGSGIIETADAYRGAIMTIGETEALYLIERLNRAYHRLPEWMRAQGRLQTDNKMLMRWEKGGVIQAFPMKREGPQTFGFSDVFFDEMALQEAARSCWKGLIPTLGDKGGLLAVSTPNGRLNLFYDVWVNKNKRYDDLLRVKIDWDGALEFNYHGEAEQFKPKSLVHDKKWLKTTSSGLTQQEVAQMFYHSFSIYAGDPVWPTFDKETHCVKETDIILSRPMLIGWDFGFHFPATTFFQYNSSDQYVGHAEYQDFDIDFGKYCEDVKMHAHSLYNPHQVPEIHFVDPAGRQRYHQRGRSGAINDIGEIKNVFGQQAQIRLGAIQVGTRDNEGPRLKEVRPLWKIRSDRRTGIVLNSTRMSNFIEGCLGGYCYPEKGGEQPDKNEACVPLTAEILTCDGFKYWYEVVGDEKIYVFDEIKKRLVVGQLLAVNVYEGKRNTVLYSSSRTEFSSTPHHRNLIVTKSGAFKYVSTKDLKQGHHLLHTFPEDRPPKQQPFSDKFITLCAWVTAEGTYVKHGAITFCESTKCNPRYVSYLSRLFADDSCIIKHREDTKKQIQTWRVVQERAYLIRQLMPQKCPSAEFVARMSNRNRRRFIYEFFRGDGCISNGKGQTYMPDPKRLGRNREVFVGRECMRAVQKRKDIIDAIQMMAVLAGLDTTIHPKGDYWSITLNRSRATSDIAYLKRQEIEVDGVWCPTTNIGNWICRQGGKTWITGNSHLQDSFQMIVTGRGHMMSNPPIVKTKPTRSRIGRRTGL